MKTSMAAARSIDELCINTIRTLCIDAVQQANSGHPGTPMAMAPVVYTLWQQFLRYDPADPIWPNRDRFVLSSGHASTLLYSLLHLTGVTSVDERYERVGTPAVALDDLRHFRQLGSKCPGHPEYHLTSGVETTTGPLGQGIANSVGMAIAADWLAKHFNRPGFALFDYDIFALCGDGCMMEGVGSEAASLAGHLRLGNLTWIYDSNHITIEGNTALAFSEDVAARFLGYRWQVLRVSDANDCERIADALGDAKRTLDRPTLIIVESHIGYGAPHKQDTSAAHGEPLGADEVRATKRRYGWPEDAKFLVPEGVYEHFAANFGARGKQLHSEWLALFERYRARYPDLADACERIQRRDLPDGWDRDSSPAAVAARRGRRFGAVDQDPADLSRGRRFRSRRPQRTQFPFRHPRTCDGIDLQRDVGVETARLRRRISDLLRLHEGADQAQRLDGITGRLCVYARFDRCWRGWSDPSAGRAVGRVTQHTGADRDASGRCQRSRRGVAGGARPQAPARLPDFVAAGFAHLRPWAVCPGKRARARRLYNGRGRRRQGPRGDPDRHRQRGCDLC
jgi:transketolase N-terminal domain/subunit